MKNVMMANPENSPAEIPWFKDLEEITPQLLNGPYNQGLPRFLGLEFLAATRHQLIAQLSVTDRIRQDFSIVHGGAYSIVTEQVASVAHALCVDTEKEVAFGFENTTRFLKPVFSGAIVAICTPTTLDTENGRGEWQINMFKKGDLPQDYMAQAQQGPVETTGINPVARGILKTTVKPRSYLDKMIPQLKGVPLYQPE